MGNDTAEWQQDTARAKDLLASGEYTCALVKGTQVFVTAERGVKPLLDLYAKESFYGFAAADKVVGKAAAFLYVLLGAKYVYAAVLSDGGEEVLRAHGIAYAYGAKTEVIINRRGTDICPMEKAVRGITDPMVALAAMQKQQAQFDAKAKG